ncbi:thiamine pyrophosphate-binding protein [Rathayibacter agropyri]
MTWDRVVCALVAHGVDTVFGLPGDDMSILGALDKRGIRVILVRDQRHALYQAIGYGRISGRPAVCFVGKGPALTHAATGLLEARSMRVPLVLISSGVAAERLGRGAFQELDPLETLGALTVGVIRVSDESIELDLTEAFRLSIRRGRGPVIVEVPEGLASRSTASVAVGTGSLSRPQIQVPFPAHISDAKRPLLLVGGGCTAETIGEKIVAFAERMGAALMVTPSGRGVIDETHPLFLGVSGLYMPAQATPVLEVVDLIIALGTRLEETATFGWEASLAPDCPIVQVLDDTRDFVLGRLTERVVADVGDAVNTWQEAPPTLADEAWLDSVMLVHSAMIEDADVAPCTTAGLKPRVRDVLRELDAALPTGRISIHENGLQDMWSYVFPHWIVHPDAACLVPSEQTPLGFGVAASRGVAAADSRPIVVIGGDGAFCAVGPDLAGFAEIEHPLVVTVLANGGFGWLEANRRQAGVPFGFLGGRAVVRGLCAAYGLNYVGCDDAAELADAVRRAWHLAQGGHCVVLDVAVELEDVPPGFEELAGDFPVALSSQPLLKGEVV